VATAEETERVRFGASLTEAAERNSEGARRETGLCFESQIRLWHISTIRCGAALRPESGGNPHLSPKSRKRQREVLQNPSRPQGLSCAVRPSSRHANVVPVGIFV
jgi:hypothetical protein